VRVKLYKEITALCWASSNGTVLAVGYLDGDIMFWKTSTTASGGKIGYEEVLTVLTLEWSARMKTLRCVGRAKLTLSGSFSDMQLLLSTRNNHGADLLVAVLDMDAFSVSFVYNGDHVKSPKGARPKDLDKPVNKLMFVCTKDATLYVYDGYDYRTLSCKPVQLKKDTTAISMHVIEGNTSVVEPVQQKESPKFNERCCSKKGTSY
ncbi:synaptobrevin, WD40/YVTN repeat-like-containing domain protein, partial [Tanacetum coccineum]